MSADLASFAAFAVAALVVCQFHAIFFGWPFSGSLLFGVFLATGVNELTSLYGWLRYNKRVYVLLMLYGIPPVIRLLTAGVIAFSEIAVDGGELVFILYILPETVRALCVLYLSVGLYKNGAFLNFRFEADIVRFFRVQRLGRIARIPFEVADKLFLGAILGDAPLAIYYIGRRLGSLALLVVDPILQITFGELGSKKRPEGIDAAFKSAMIIGAFSALYCVAAYTLMEIRFVQALIISSSNVQVYSASRAIFYLGFAISAFLSVSMYLTAILNLFRREASSLKIELLSLFFLICVLLFSDSVFVVYAVFFAVLIQISLKTYILFSSRR